MPIFIRDFCWKQTDSAIVINIPIKNVRSSKLHLFSSCQFVKVNYESYIFELFLHKNVLESKTKCIVRPDEIILELQKVEPEIWESLHQNIQHKQIVEKIEQVLDEKREHEATQTKAKKEKKEEVTKYLKDEMMNIHMNEKELIRQVKKNEILAAAQEIQSWESSVNENVNVKITPLSVPFPRKSATIKFSFTPRVFPTPKRESKSQEEKEWLEKEAEARRCAGFIAEELTDEEKNPEWLLSKGKSFMSHENYLGAINIFAYGIELKPKMPIFHVRLGEAHLKLKHFYKAAECATKALDLLQPVVPKNKTLRAEAYKIRSEAFTNMGETSLGESDSNAAKSLLK